MAMADFKMSVQNNIEGYKIIKYIDFVTERINVGNGWLLELFSKYPNESVDMPKMLDKAFKELRLIALSGLEKKAIDSGANGIVAATVFVDKLNGNEIPLYVAKARGLAVFITQNDDGQYDTEKNVFGEEIKKIIDTKLYSDKIKSEGLRIDNLISLIEESVNKNITVPLSVIISDITTDKSYYDNNDTRINRLILFLKMYDNKELSKELNRVQPIIFTPISIIFSQNARLEGCVDREEIGLFQRVYLFYN